MGLFSFLKSIGRKVAPGREAEDIQNDIINSLGSQVENLQVVYSGGDVTLSGSVDSRAAAEKAVLLAGNVESVERVIDHLTVKAEAPVFYTVQKGDSLSQIAKSTYGDAMKWEALFEANKEVIKDPDLIYPGQQIRIPKL